MEVAEKVDFSRRVVVHDLLVPLTTAGKQYKHMVVALLNDIYGLVVEAETEGSENREEMTAYMYELKVAHWAYAAMAASGPEVTEAITVNRGDIRAFLTGQFSPHWELVSEAIEKSDWGPDALECKRVAFTDLTLGPEKREAIRSLGSGGLEELDAVLEKLPNWMSLSRKGGLQDLEDKICER